MDGKGRCLDNIFVERLWRSVKYENIYLYGYQSIPEARKGLEEYFEFYNYERFHQGLDNKTPWQVYSQNKEVSEYSLVPFRDAMGYPGVSFLESEGLKLQIASFAQ